MPFFATLDMHELVVRQIEADDEHYLLDAPLVLFNTLGTALEGEVFLDLSIISQKPCTTKLCLFKTSEG